MSPQIQALDMQDFQINNLAAGTVASDAARIDQTINSVTTSGTGLIAQTAASTWATRTLQPPAAGITISNPGGVAGNPTFALADDLAGLEGMSSTGLVARTGSGTYANRTVTGTTDIISLTNGDGISGNPTIDIASRKKAGWTQVHTTEVWTYGSATTINVPSDATTRYNVGDKIHIVQSSTDLYYYVTGVSATVLTVVGTAAVANTTISSMEFSKEVLPVNFPDWIAWTPTQTGFSADPSNAAYRFKITGRKVTAMVSQNTNGTSNATGFTISAPVTAATVSNGNWGGNVLLAVDNGAVITATQPVVYIASAGTVFNLHPSAALGNWTNANGKRAYFMIDYEI